MSKTALSPTQPSRSTGGRRWLRAAVPVVVVAAGVGTWVVHHERGATPVVFGPMTHQVVYEVNGKGTANNITYADASDAKSSTDGNVTLRHVALPWRMTVTMPVSLGGGVASLASTNPASTIPAGSESSGAMGSMDSMGSAPQVPDDAPPLVCRISVDGKLVAQRTSTDGTTDAACSALLAPKRS